MLTFRALPASPSLWYVIDNPVNAQHPSCKSHSLIKSSMVIEKGKSCPNCFLLSYLSCDNFRFKYLSTAFLLCTLYCRNLVLLNSTGKKYAKIGLNRSPITSHPMQRHLFPPIQPLFPLGSKKALEPCFQIGVPYQHSTHPSALIPQFSSKQKSQSLRAKTVWHVL